MKLSIIIVSYNTASLTKQTIESVENSLLKDSFLKDHYEIIVVDNQSQDQSVAVLKKLQAKKRFPLKIILAKENLGFGRANNLGFKSATGQEILFLNSDTIVQKGALEKLLITAEKLKEKKSPIGLVAAQLLNQDGSPQPQGGDLPNLFSLFTTMFFLDDIPFLGKLLPSVQHTGKRFNSREIKRKTVLKKGWVAGTACLIDRELFAQIEGFDPQIFLYGEDQELCYRLRQEGCQHYIATESLIKHLGSASSSSARAILGEIAGYLYFWKKYKTSTQFEHLRGILWFAALLRLMIFSFKNDKKRAAIYQEVMMLVKNAN